MGHRHAVLSLSTLLFLVPCCPLFAQGNQQQSSQQQSVPAPTLRVTSSLVFLDVTVLDKKGHPVVTGLTRDDFTITEDKKPQRIFSFEPPDVHTINARSSDENPDGRPQSPSLFSIYSTRGSKISPISATQCANFSSRNRSD